MKTFGLKVLSDESNLEADPYQPKRLLNADYKTSSSMKRDLSYRELSDSGCNLTDD